MAHVLVVDDDRAIRELLRVALELDGHEVVTLSNGCGVLAALGVLPQPSLMLLDLMMPYVSGWDICAALVGEPHLLNGARLVVMTAGLTSAEPCPAPADALLAKPFDLNTLLDLVTRLTQPDASLPSARQDVLPQSLAG